MRPTPPSSTIGMALIAILLAACGPSSDGPTSTNGPATTTADVSTVSSTPSSPDLLFPPVDTGVATTTLELSQEEAAQLEPAPVGPGGDRFRLVACRLTWFNRYEFEVEWTPGPETALPAIRQVALLMTTGDIGEGMAVDVELSDSGTFVVPWVRVEAAEGETSGSTEDFDRANGSTCDIEVYGMATIEIDEATTPVEVALRPPVATHEPSTLQGMIEATDPLEGGGLGPIASLASQLEPFPVDIVYLLPGEDMARAVFQRDGTCLRLEIAYEGGGGTTQEAGCPTSGDNAGGTWSVDASGIEPTDLVAVPWQGHPGVDAMFDAGKYLDERELEPGVTEIYRTVIDGTYVAVYRYEAEGDATRFWVEGVGVTAGGGGFPGESWDGCLQVEYSDAGYSMIVVADPGWSVTVNGEDVVLERARDVGVAVVPTVIDSPYEIEVVGFDGEPACFE